MKRLQTETEVNCSDKKEFNFTIETKISNLFKLNTMKEVKNY